MAEEHYDRDFPNLRKLGVQKTSEPDWYNCIAYAAGDFQNKWWPDDFPPRSRQYWPLPITDWSDSIDVFIAAFATIGYQQCSDGKWEKGYEKVAFYALGGKVQHAARQQANGKWRSKLNEDEDIEHTLEGLEGPCYGNVVAFLIRRISGTPLPSESTLRGKNRRVIRWLTSLFRRRS